MFPLLAALPDNGPTPAWTPYLLGLPPLVAALAAARAQRRNPTLRWDEGALRGCAGGVLAGVLLGVLAALAGGAVGPGRMRDVGRRAFDVLVHAVTAFGHRRPARRAGDDLVAAAGVPRPGRRRRLRLHRVTCPRARRPVVVLVSGSGTNLQALLDACADPAYGARWSPSAPTATASRAWRGPSGPASRPSCKGSRTSPDPRALGPRRWPTPSPAFEPDLVVLAGFMKLVGERRSSRRSAAGSSTPTRRCRRRSPGCTGRPTRWRTA